MITVRDLMHPDPMTIAPEESLRDAAEFLVSAGIGGAPVVQGGRVVGVVSLRDILASEAEEPSESRYRPEGDASAAEPGIDEVLEEEDLEEPARWHLDLWTGSGRQARAWIEEAEEWEGEPPEERRVEEVMTRNVLTVAPDAPVRSAAEVMATARIHRVLVVEKGAPVGILTSSDIVRGVAEGLLVPAS